MTEGEARLDGANIVRYPVATASRRSIPRFIQRKSRYGSKAEPVRLPSRPNLGPIWRISGKRTAREQLKSDGP